MEEAGRGAFVPVWKALDKELDRTVAIKIPRQGGMTAEEQEKFFREARAAAQLRHPSIVSVHEVGRDGESVYIVSDFVRGVTLGDWLTGQQPTSREAAELCAKIADALHHAHEQGVVHRDLKPANIMIDGDGQPHLMDFGLARREAGEVTMTLGGQVVGTPAYMSPEQAQGEAHTADRRSDVYSLGVILFQLLTGELPFRGNARMIMHQVIRDEPPSPRKFNANIPKDLETVTLRCLEKDPTRRYPTAQHLAAELRRFLADKPIEARPVGRVERTWRWCRRNPALAGAAGATVALMLTLAVGSPIAAFRINSARQKAEEARTKEADLRIQVQWSEKVVRAAQSLISNGEFHEAEKLIDGVPGWARRVNSRDAAEVFLALADWHGGDKRWEQAATYYHELVFGADLRELNVDPGSVTMTYLVYAPLLVEFADKAGYETLRESAIATFGAISVEERNVATAERMLMACLLLPADEAQMVTYGKWAEITATVSFLNSFRCWQYVALGLYEHRRGNHVRALDWGRKCLASTPPPACRARAHVIMAMGYSRLDGRNEAQAQLARCCEMIERKFEGKLGVGQVGQDYWADWLINRVLLREANALLESPATRKTTETGDTSPITGNKLGATESNDDR